MRPNSVSVLPSHSSPPFKDKPRAGGMNGSPGGPPGIAGRITLRRIILFSGGFLFVYIILSTILGPSPNDSGFPVVKQKERDPYIDLPNPIPNDPNSSRAGGTRGGRPPSPQNQSDAIDHRMPKQAPVIQLEPVDGEARKWYDEDRQVPGKDKLVSEEGGSSTGGSSNGAVIVDDEGDTVGGGGGGEVEESKVALAAKERKASSVSYAQFLSASRRERDYAIALMIREADLALYSTEVCSVTIKSQTAPSNDVHDYLSLSKYYWPDREQPNGLPYKRIDGHINPEIETVRDYRLLRTMIREVHIMGMAYHFTGRKEYADKSAMRLKEWFLDEATYMNPNINFGSLRKGEKLGARTGVLDMFPIFRVFDVLHYLKQEETWPQDLIPRLQEWFGRYADWLETSPLAQVERDGNNNHGTYFDVQAIGIYIFLGRREDARDIARAALHKRIDSQITATGEQPEELARKTSWYYSVFNLQALMTLARWGDDLGVDMWFYEGPEGQSIKKAIDFLLPYSLSGGEDWPVENLKGFDMTDYLKCLQVAWYIYGDEKYIEAIGVLEPNVQKDMDEGKVKTVSTFMCDISTLLEATRHGGQGFVWHWCLT